MRGHTVSSTTAGAMRNAGNLMGASKSYARSASRASMSGKSGMASHKAGMQSAGLS